jgi:hypothetical protein
MQPPESTQSGRFRVNRRAGASTTLAVTLVGGVSVMWFQAHAQSARPDAAQAVEMRNHYAVAIEMKTAVIRGDLAATATAAQALIQYPELPGATARTSRYVTAIRQAAADSAAAPNIVVAAVSFASMLNACGQCHLSVGVRPPGTPRPPPELGGVVGHMLAHQRAADQIFLAVVTPSDALWRDGTRAFATEPLLRAADLPAPSKERRQMTATEERMHRLASDAAQATDPRARANYYGQLLAGCADCHSRSAKWGPPGW